MKRKECLCLAIFLAISFCFTCANAQFSLSLSPLLVELELTPGAKKNFSLFVSNDDPANDINLIVYIRDMVETRKGAYRLADDTVKSEFSCADWMKIEDTSFTLKPSETKEIKVQIAAPRSVFGGRYGTVVFEIVPEEPPPGKTLGGMRYHFKMPAFVEVTIKRFGGLRRKAGISEFKVEPVSIASLEKELGEKPLGFIASVKNEGNIHLVGKGTLIIKDEKGRTKRRVPLGGGRGSVIPGATVDFKSLLRRPPPGEYVARAVVNFGGLSPVVAEIPFTVTRTKTSSLGSFKASSYIALDIKPEQLETKIPTRGFRAATFSLRNAERDTVEVKAYIMNVGYDLEGRVVLLDSSETHRSCRDWIAFEPEDFTIAPGKGETVKLTIQVPTQGAGGYYACLVFDALLKNSKEDAISTPFLVPLILSVPPDLDKKGEIVDLQIEASAGKPALIAAYFKNTGNIHLKLKGKVSLKLLKEFETTGDIKYIGKPEYEKVDELPFEEVEQYVLPDGIRMMEAGYPGALQAGKYLAEVTVDYEGSSPAKFEKEFTVK